MGVDAAYFDNITQMANGLSIGALFGFPYDVRRLGPKSNGSILAQPPILQAKFQLTRSTKRDFVESQLFDLTWFVAVGDGRALQLGDILTGTGTDKASYCYAQHRLNAPLIFVRVETTATILFPNDAASADTPGDSSSTPTTFQQAYGGQTLATNKPLVLKNGQYSVGNPGDTPAQVPVGRSILNRVRNSVDTTTTDMPDSPPPTNSLLYVPPLGVPLAENVLVQLQDSSVFRILDLYETTTIELVGTVAVVTKAQAFK